MDVSPTSFLFAAEVHVDHRVFTATTVDLVEFSTPNSAHTLSSIFNHDFVEWGGAYFKTLGTSNPSAGGKLVIDTKEQRLLRRENKISARKSTPSFILF